MLNPLVVVDFTDIRPCIPACVMSSEFTRGVVMKLLPAQFLKFDVNIFEAVWSIQRYDNLTEYKEVILKKSLLITHAGMQIWL